MGLMHTVDYENTISTFKVYGKCLEVPHHFSFGLSASLQNN